MLWPVVTYGSESLDNKDRREKEIKCIWDVWIWRCMEISSWTEQQSNEEVTPEEIYFINIIGCRQWNRTSRGPFAQNSNRVQHIQRKETAGKTEFKDAQLDVWRGKWKCYEQVFHPKAESENRRRVKEPIVKKSENIRRSLDPRRIFKSTRISLAMFSTIKCNGKGWNTRTRLFRILTAVLLRERSELCHSLEEQDDDVTGSNVSKLRPQLTR